MIEGLKADVIWCALLRRLGGDCVLGAMELKQAEGLIKDGNVSMQMGGAREPEDFTLWVRIKSDS